MKTIRLKQQITPPPATQKTIILESLAGAYPTALTLDQLIGACESRGYRRRLSPDIDIYTSVQYHLDRMDEIEQCSN
jgi:hypothetical protein